MAGGIVTAGILPLRATAAGGIEALGVTCIDYRLVDDGVNFFHTQHLTGEYDQLALAGASLAAVSPAFPTSNRAFWDHVAIARKLHDIKKVVVLDHRDCGAYKVAFGKAYAGAGAPESAQHKGVMEKVKAELARRHPELMSEYWLMALDGKAERVI
jgi:carbonic anhydrase